MARARTYRELRQYPDFESRFEYLRLNGEVGEATFGSDRWVNQAFYKSFEWRHVRNQVIARDSGCDLGVPGYEIHSEILIHHIDPITVEDIHTWQPKIIDPDNLITTTLRTHNAIHYGDGELLPKPLVERTRGDTQLW